jgi:hypothetical protein
MKHGTPLCLKKSDTISKLSVKLHGLVCPGPPGAHSRQQCRGQNHRLGRLSPPCYDSRRPLQSASQLPGHPSRTTVSFNNHLSKITYRPQQTLVRCLKHLSDRTTQHTGMGHNPQLTGFTPEHKYMMNKLSLRLEWNY